VSKLRIPDDVMAYFRKTGAMGGRARARKHSKEQLSEWAKLGGRPKGSSKKETQGRKIAK
jgi:hypothetical protein